MNVEKEGSKYDRSQINPHIRTGQVIPVEEVADINEAIRDFTMETDYSVGHADDKREAGGINDILNERGSNYGAFESHAAISQRMKSSLKDGEGWVNCSVSQKETLEMICHKMARIVNGDPTYLDSWVDIIGYTQLIVEQLED